MEANGRARNIFFIFVFILFSFLVFVLIQDAHAQKETAERALVEYAEISRALTKSFEMKEITLQNQFKEMMAEAAQNRNIENNNMRARLESVLQKMETMQNQSATAYGVITITPPTPTPTPMTGRSIFKIPDTVSPSPHLQMDPPIDFEDLPQLTGPRQAAVNNNKSLVIACIGKSERESWNNTITRLGHDDYVYMLFLYDKTSWEEYPWYSNLNVVSIRILHKMKFWYFKRFVTPSVVECYTHVIMFDADITFAESFNMQNILKIMEKYNLGIVQPAHSLSSHANYGVLRVTEGDHIGRYVRFIEIGPIVVFTRKGYQCIYNLFQDDLTSGWGLDFIWVEFMRVYCGFSANYSAVIDMYQMEHAVSTGGGSASSQANFIAAATNELYTYISRFPEVPTVPWEEVVDSKIVKFGSSSCVPNFEGPNCQSGASVSVG